MKISLLIGLLVFLAVVGLGVGYFFGLSKSSPCMPVGISKPCLTEQQTAAEPVAKQPQTIEKDATNIISEISDEQAIALILADKHEHDFEDVHFSIIERQDSHIFGTVCFGDVDEYGRRDCGGVWATKAGGVWQVLADGNGAVSCFSLEEWGYPRELSHGCTDQF